MEVGFFDFDDTMVMSKKAFVELFLERKSDFNHITLLVSNPTWKDVLQYDFSDVFKGMTQRDITNLFESSELFDRLEFFRDTEMSMLDVYLRYSNHPKLKLMVATKGSPNNISLKHLYLPELIEGFNLDSDFIGIPHEVVGKSNLTGLFLIDDHEDNLYTANVTHKILYSQDGLRCDYNKTAMEDPNILKAFTPTELDFILNKIVSEL